MDDLLGWQNTRWGMTETEIIQAVGADRLKRTERQSYQHMYADLVIPNVDVDKYAFDIIFQMSSADDRLSQVLVKHQADPASEPRAPRESAQRMISERFGRGSRIGTSDAWHWKFPTTTIELNVYYIEDIVSDVAVRFFPSGSALASQEASAF